MDNRYPNPIVSILAAVDLLPESRREYILGYAEGVLAAAGQHSEERDTMHEKSMKILATIATILPHMSEELLDRFLYFVEGMAFMAEKRRAEQERASA